MKVVYICPQFLMLYLETDILYIKHLIDNGVEVEYWDLTNIYYSEPPDISNKLVRNYVREVRGYEHLKEMIVGEPPDTKYIMVVDYSFKLFRLYWILSRRKCRMYFLRHELAPRKGWLPLIRRCHRIFKTLTRLFGLIKPFEVIFCVHDKPGWLEARRGVQINAPGYEKWRTTP
jgi:hypothetical protein